MRLLTIAAALLVAVALSGCTTSAMKAGGDASARPTPSAPPVEEPLSMAVFGDSITSWNPPYRYRPEQSWVTTASRDIPLVCGWARPGAKLAEMAAGAEPCSAYFLVMMGGTNDLYAGTPVADRLAALDAIAATVDAEYVMVLAVAPYGFDWAAGAEWNRQLAAHASSRGWMFLDPWAAAGVRTADNQWAVGGDFGDRIHPSPASAAGVAAAVREALQLVHVLTA